MAQRLIELGAFVGRVEALRDCDPRLYHKQRANGVCAIGMQTLYAGEQPLGLLGVSFAGDSVPTGPQLSPQLQRYGVQIASLLSNSSLTGQ